MPQRETLVASNFRGLDGAAAALAGVRHEYVGEGGLKGFVRACLRADVVVLNVEQQRLMLACLLKWLMPWSRFKLVSADLILRPPRTAPDRLKVFVKKILLARVDRFVLYFKDLRGYERHYGIDPARVTYVPFKVNGWELISERAAAGEGEYVLCAGRTLRDTATFVEAMRRANCPGVLLQQSRELLSAHGTQAWSGELPPNLKLVTDDGDKLEDYLDSIARARLVVIPRFRGDIAATGISTYLVAMALGRCVVISAGPGAEDVLDGQAVIVPPEDAGALARRIELLWNDARLRSEVAARGRQYAAALEGEARLLADILRAALDCLRPAQNSARGRIG